MTRRSLGFPRHAGRSRRASPLWEAFIIFALSVIVFLVADQFMRLRLTPDWFLKRAASRPQLFTAVFFALLVGVLFLARHWRSEFRECQLVSQELVLLGRDLDRQVETRTAEILTMNRRLQLEIVERELAEGSLRSSERRISALIENAKDAIYVSSAEGVVLLVNHAAEVLQGRPRVEIVGSPVADAVAPDERERVGRAFASTALGGSLAGFHTFSQRADGARVPVEVSASLVEVGTERVVHAIVRDISERILAEEALRESEQRYRAIFDASPLPMYLYDQHALNIVAVNEAGIEYYGYSREEFLGMTLLDLRVPEEQERLLESFREEANPPARERSGIWKQRKKDGAPVEVEVHSQSVLLEGKSMRLAIMLDVTEQHVLEEQLRRSQKMEAVGRLAGGVAHDFNNLITVISGFGDMILGKIPVADPLRPYVGEIMKASGRAADLTRQLLAFSRGQVLQPQILELGTVVRSAEKILQRLIGEDIELVVVTPQRLGHVKVDPGQIEQILMNLAANSRDAMAQGGRLTIEVADVDLRLDGSPLQAEIEPGPYVMVTVTDTGHGMSKEILSRAFEPFFTTKEMGKGTGLGLATVHGIVKQSGGQIFVYSEPHAGTTFKIYFPRVEDASSTSGLAPATTEFPRGSETILLVEDEESLRSLVQEFLAASGYSVIEVRHAGEALSIIERPETKIQLLLTDVVMPGLSGRKLAEQVQRLHPETKILFMSGYTDDDVIRHGVLAEEVAFLQKPFTREVLLQRVRGVLDAR